MATANVKTTRTYTITLDEREMELMYETLCVFPNWKTAEANAKKLVDLRNAINEALQDNFNNSSTF